ncbi:MAG: DUF4136 domain-containing protein [Myxococcota bacterium]
MTRIGLVGGLAVLALACAKPQLQSNVFFDHDADFPAFKTFAIAGGTGGTDTNRTLAEKEVRKGLAAKGLRAVDAGQADLLVQVDLGRRAKVRLSGAGSRGEYAGIVIGMRTRKANALVWQAVAALTYYESLDPAVEIPKAVALALEDFPPS